MKTYNPLEIYELPEDVNPNLIYEIDQGTFKLQERPENSLANKYLCYGCAFSRNAHLCNNSPRCSGYIFVPVNNTEATMTTDNSVQLTYTSKHITSCMDSRNRCPCSACQAIRK